MTLGVGIVGCGFIGGVHSFVLGALVKAGLVDAAVVAAHDVDRERAERVADHHGAQVCDDVEQLIEAVDAVWVCTWTAAHLEVVRASVERSRAIFCEKPLAPSLPECKEVAALLERVPHQVGLVLRHAPVFRQAAEAIASGAHGRPLAAVLRDDQYFPIQGQYGSDWRADAARAGGGTLIEHSIHDVDVLQWLLGDPKSVRAGVEARFGHPGIDDVAMVTLEYPDGAMATIASVWHQVLSRPSSRRLEVFCEDGFLWTDNDYLGPLHVQTALEERVLEAQPPPWAEQLDVPAEFLAAVSQYAEPTKAFLDVLRSGSGARRGWPDAATALRAHEIVDAAYRSAAAGGHVVPLGT